MFRICASIALAIATSAVSPAFAKDADVFWKSKQACLARQIDFDKIKSWLNVNNIELKLAELDVPSVKSSPKWSDQSAASKRVEEALAVLLSNIEAVCQTKYPN